MPPSSFRGDWEWGRLNSAGLVVWLEEEEEVECTAEKGLKALAAAVG